MPEFVVPHSCKESAPRDDSPKILCIDDDPEVSGGLEIRLRPYCVTVVRAFHGMHGFWLAMTERPDLIITDVNMPQGHGDYVVECLRRNHETADIPVIVLTGSRNPRTKKKMLALGIDAYLTKPCAGRELESVIRAYVELGSRNQLVPSS